MEREEDLIFEVCSNEKVVIIKTTFKTTELENMTFRTRIKDTKGYIEYLRSIADDIEEFINEDN